MAYKELYNFLKDWLAWARAGGQGVEFDNSMGLCGNSEEYGVSEKLARLLKDDFEENSYYPFNDDELDYDVECYSNNTPHKNPKRLAWVEKKVVEYETRNKGETK